MSEALKWARSATSRANCATTPSTTTRAAAAGRTYSCECGYDSKTERLQRAAASRIEELEATLRGIRERQAPKREDKQE